MNSEPEKEKPVTRLRLSADITKETRDLLESTTNLMNSGSYTETIRRSLVLTNLVIKIQKEGGKLQFRKSDGTVETYMVI